MYRTRILIAEAHSPLRVALRTFLEASAEAVVVAEALDGEEAIQLTGRREPDIVLLDSGLPGLNAFAVARRIKEQCPKTKVIIVADEDSEDYWIEAQDSGASAYVAKNRIDRDLPGVIRSLLK